LNSGEEKSSESYSDDVEGMRKREKEAETDEIEEEINREEEIMKHKFMKDSGD
jgi:hypothetical protein